MTNISYFIVSFASIFCLINLAITLFNIYDTQRYFYEDQITGKVVVLIPARNEEKRIEPLLYSLNSQTKIENLTVVVIDDDSQDQTAKIVENFFENSFLGSIDTHLLKARPIPNGWNGKSNALQTGFLAFPDADLYVTLDADIELSGNAISSSATSMLRHGDSFLSPYPKQVCSHWTHLLVQPLLQWSWLATLPLRTARSSARSSTAVANGQFFVVSGDALRSVGGFQDAAHHVLDDLALARSLKRAGFSGTAIPAPQLSRCRMYYDWSDLGWEKIPVCVAYEIDGQRVEEVPSNQSDFHHAKPIYEYLPGWKEDISTAAEFSDLPKNAQSYVRFLEEISGAPMSAIGVGPGRTQTISVRDLIS